MALELNFEIKELQGNTSFIIKDVSAPSYTQTGWSEGSCPAFSTIVNHIEVFTITLPDESVVDLSSYWNSVVSAATTLDDLYLEVTPEMLGLASDTLLEDGLYTLDVQVDPSGAGYLYGVTITYMFVGRLEQVVYSLSSNIIDYYGLDDIESKTYVEDMILAQNLLDAIDFNVRSTKFEDAKILYNNLSTLLNKYE